jgi:hypothetical protein
VARRILVVDDEPVLRMLISRAFRERAYEVVVLDPRLPIIHLSGSHSGRGSRIMLADVPTILKPFDIWDLVAEAEMLIAQREG